MEMVEGERKMKMEVIKEAEEEGKEKKTKK